VNINITQLPQRWKEISSYKDQPVFIYCSHSQRSRRASRLLADSGFTNIFNINGGLTDFYNQGIESNPCATFEIESSVPYKIISPKQLADANKGKSYYVVDLRSDSVFRGISTERSKLEGRFTDAINIPFEKFKSLTSFDFPDKPILLIDEFGNESPQAARMLTAKGLKDVTILFDGMDGWVDYAANSEINLKSVSGWKQNPRTYNLISAPQFGAMAKTNMPVLIDVRTKEEFSNASKNYWQNVGQVKGAVNIPANEIKTSTLLPKSKNENIVLYGFNSQPEIFESAKALADLGYKNVNILQGGIWRLRWASHNIKGKEYLNDLVVNVPEQNQ
jgi:rhodanese-related sulfurtransferase